MCKVVRLFLMAVIFMSGAVSAAEGDNSSSGSLPQEAAEIDAGVYLNRPLEEAIQDVEAITQIQNMPENLEQNSNDILKLDSVILDKKAMSVVYTFQFKIDAGSKEMQQHAKIGNTYIIRDLSGKEVVNIESRYEKCSGDSRDNAPE